MIRAKIAIVSRICVMFGVFVLLLVAGYNGYKLWQYHQPKFHNMTLELGNPLPETDAFLNEDASSKEAKLLTKREDIKVDEVGTQTLTFRYGRKKQTVTLTVQDTTAPDAIMQEVTADIGTVLNPQDFVCEILDQSPVTVDFVRTPQVPEGYGEENVLIRLTDAWGNSSVKKSKVFYCWIRKSVTVELGTVVKKSDLLLNQEKDGHLVDQAQIDRINAGGVGTYTVTSTSGNEHRECTVVVVDTTPPTLKLKVISLYLGGTASVQSFVETAEDNSGKVHLSFVTTPDFNKVGTQRVGIEAQDSSGNCTGGEVTLTIMRDTTPPGFSGMDEIKVNKNQVPNYTVGVSAYDANDGYVSYTYNERSVNLSKAGIYYVVYTAKDKMGNTATYRRKVTVNHDSSDTSSLVTSIASELSSDPEEIRDYVRWYIAYSSDWGGSDPVWYGFQNRKGNCYVHALCLQALLTEKGYTTQLIWVTDRSHYWLIIWLNGTWYHIDATPSSKHGKYSLMSDAQRYETLSGRDWDRAQWPKCG